MQTTIIHEKPTWAQYGQLQEHWQNETQNRPNNMGIRFLLLVAVLLLLAASLVAATFFLIKDTIIIEALPGLRIDDEERLLCSKIAPGVEACEKYKISGGCGLHNPGGVLSRSDAFTPDPTASARAAEFGEFPWVVGIYQVGSRGDEKYVGPGALVAHDVVMTAAHKVRKFEKAPQVLRVRAGYLNNAKNDLMPSQNQSDVELIEIHPDYNPGIIVNNGALLILSGPFTLRKHINTICLPRPGHVFREGSKCVVTGWEEGKAELRSLGLPIVPNDMCLRRLRSDADLEQTVSLDDTSICAGGEEGMDMCKGTGGSPLACPVEGYPSQYLLAGLVSWGIGCGKKDMPGVYTNVASMSSWVQNTIAQKSKYWTRVMTDLERSNFPRRGNLTLPKT